MITLLCLSLLAIAYLARSPSADYQPTSRQRRQWRKSRLVIDVPNRRR